MDSELYRRVIGGAALTAPLPARALWCLSGPDAMRYLNGQTTNDVAALTEGQACYAAVCTAKGRMEGDLSIARHGEAFYLDADPVLRVTLGARLEKYLIADDAQLEELTDLWNLSHFFGATPPDAPEAGFIVAYNRFGLPGHDVWTQKPASPFVGETVTDDILETLRLESGIPRWGTELTTTTLPPEAGPHMLRAISYTKGCYVGQETIARLKSVGHVNRSLAFLESESAAFPPVGAPLRQGDKEVGTITSSGPSPRLGKGVALGYVQRLAATKGVLLEADGLKLTVTDPLSAPATP